VLGPASFVASGGEASVYARGETAYKIYTDPARTPSKAKLHELSRLHHPAIQLPTGRVFDSNTDSPVGLSLPFVSGAVPLASLVARSAKERHGLDHTAALGLMSSLQDVVAHCHSQGIQIVDLNSMNVLVRTGRSVPELYVIDVDSWQCAGHPATALQDAVRDRRSEPGVYTPETDWFSFAVVALQFLLGVHPYKGKHPRVRGLDLRMKRQISIFDSDVRVPPMCGDLNGLPAAWRSWVERILQTDFRGPPPALVAAPHPRPDARVFEEYRLARRPARGPWVRTRTPQSGRPVRVSLEDHRLQIWLIDSAEVIPFGLHVDALSVCEQRVHIQSGPQILELQLHETGRALLATAVPRARVLSHGTRLFDGVAVQDLLGTAWISRLDHPGTSPQLRVPELDGERVVHGDGHQGRIRLWLNRDGRFDRLELHFDCTGGYAATWMRDVDLEPSSRSV